MYGIQKMDCCQCPHGDRHLEVNFSSAVCSKLKRRLLHDGQVQSVYLVLNRWIGLALFQKPEHCNLCRYPPIKCSIQPFLNYKAESNDTWHFIPHSHTATKKRNETSPPVSPVKTYPLPKSSGTQERRTNRRWKYTRPEQMQLTAMQLKRVGELKLVDCTRSKI